jgi:hypothetical protein
MIVDFIAASSGWDFHCTQVGGMMIVLQDAVGFKPCWSAWHSSSDLVVTFLCSC